MILFHIYIDSAEYIESEEHPEILTSDSMAFYDPRLKFLGGRIICPKDSLEVSKLGNFTIKSNLDDYNIARILYGVPEGDSEVKNALPLNLNFHHLNGISFKKGCYIGQELTQRTYYTGVLRKKLMPYVITDKMNFSIQEDSTISLLIPYNSIDKSYDLAIKNKEIKSEDGVVIGSVVNQLFNCGLCLIDTEKLNMINQSKFNIEGLNIVFYDPVELWKTAADFQDIGDNSSDIN